MHFSRLKGRHTSPSKCLHGAILVFFLSRDWLTVPATCFVNKVLLAHRHIHSWTIVYGGFHSTMAELSGRVGDLMACKAYDIYHLFFTENVCPVLLQSKFFAR